MAAVLQLFAPAKNRGRRRAQTRLHRPVAPLQREHLSAVEDRRGHRDSAAKPAPPRTKSAQAAVTLGWPAQSAGRDAVDGAKPLPADQAVVLDLFGQPPIIFHRIYVELTGSVTAALWFSHAMDRLSHNPGAEHAFDMTQPECQALTGLTRREQDTARARLREAGLITEERRGSSIRFRVNVEVLSKLLMEQSGRRWAGPAALATEGKGRFNDDKADTSASAGNGADTSAGTSTDTGTHA